MSKTNQNNIMFVNLGQTLVDELPGILAFAVAGLNQRSNVAGTCHRHRPRQSCRLIGPSPAQSHCSIVTVLNQARRVSKTNVVPTASR